MGFERDFAPLTTGIMRVTVEEVLELMAVGGALSGAESVIKAFMSGRYSVALTVRNFATMPAGATPALAPKAAPRSPGLFASIPRYVRDPIILSRMGPKPGDANRVVLPSLDDAVMPEILREYLRMSEKRLTAGGFRPPVYTRSREDRNLASVASLFEHPDDYALGFTLVSVAKNGNVTAVTSFMSYFADGWRVSTSNSSTVLRTPSQPKMDGARFCDLLDTRALYEIHRRRVRERVAKVDIVPKTRGADPLAFVNDEARKTHAHWIRKGYYKLVDGDRIQLTALGAMFSAWRGLYPWKQFTERRMDRKSAAILARLGITGRR